MRTATFVFASYLLALLEMHWNVSVMDGIDFSFGFMAFLVLILIMCMVQDVREIFRKRS